MSFEDGFGEIFDENDEGRSAKGMEDVLGHLTHLIEHHEVPVSKVLEALLNILQPGSTESSHDVLGMFRVCMFLQGHGDVLEHFGAIWLTEFPWGVGFHIGIERGFSANSMSFEAKRAMIRSLCAVMQAGGINAEMTERDRIKITHNHGKEQDIDIDQVVNQFREELDEKLGPDAPIDPQISDITSEEQEQITDWMKRWLPDQ